jgi:hypothetical protein
VTEPHPTNIRVLTPSRKALRAGDVFAIGLPDESFVFGKVIEAAAEIGPFGPGSNLIYIYRCRSRTTTPDLTRLQPSELLIPPLFINRLPWSRGYFENVEHTQVRPEDRLARHCFYSSARQRYVDERGKELAEPSSPCGDWGLHSFRTVDDLISDATGFARIPE